MPLRERQLFGKDSQKRRAVVDMDFSLFQVLISVLLDIAYFNFMTELAKGSIKISLHVST